MDPIISNIQESRDILTFTLSGVNVSLANALRRIILSEIPTVVIRTTPYDKNNVNIDINTTRMNNEIIKQRISCIPVYNFTDGMDINDFEIFVDKKNDSHDIQYVTTKDFRIKNLKSDKFLDEKERDKFFPPDHITNDYIEIVRLRPKVSNNESSIERLKFSAKFDYGKAKEDGAFNVVSTCSYSSGQDIEEANKQWNNKYKELKEQGLTDDDIENTKKDWFLLDAKRITKKDVFNFIVETVGQYKNKDIVLKSLKIMIDKLNKLKTDLNEKENEMINKSSSTIENCFDIVLIGEDYTLGKVIEFIVYEKHYKKEVTYCGFIKPHPHIDMSILRIAFNDNEVNIKQLLVSASDDAIKIYSQITQSFN